MEIFKNIECPSCIFSVPGCFSKFDLSDFNSPDNNKFDIVFCNCYSVDFKLGINVVCSHFVNEKTINKINNLKNELELYQPGPYKNHKDKNAETELYPLYIYIDCYSDIKSLKNLDLHMPCTTLCIHEDLLIDEKIDEILDVYEKIKLKNLQNGLYLHSGYNIGFLRDLKIKTKYTKYRDLFENLNQNRVNMSKEFIKNNNIERNYLYKWFYDI